MNDPDRAVSRAPEHSWTAAMPLVYPVLRPVGTTGRLLADLATSSAAAGDTRPLLDPGPAGLRIGYILHAGRYGVQVNGDHLAAWSVPPDTLRRIATTNLRAWSAIAPWTFERDGQQVLLSSVTGDGWDAARILLPEAIEHLATTLGGAGMRVLVAVPTADLLVATGLGAEDPGFALPFARFAESYAAGADAPIDGRVFEILRGELTPFEP